MQKNGVLLFFFLIFFPTVFYSADPVYTSGISIRKLNDSKAGITWYANTNRFIFRIYRSASGPIMNVSNLIKSELFFSNICEGKPEKSLFVFPMVTNDFTNTGKYYFAVFPDSASYKPENFQPTLNLTLEPLEITNIEIKINSSEIAGISNVIQTEKARTISGLTIRTNFGSVLLFWEADQLISSGLGRFQIYRTTNSITNGLILSNLTPMGEVLNDTYFEDNQIPAGTAFYYTVIANGKFVILPGTNQTLNPVFWGDSNKIVKIEREIWEKKKVSRSEYEKHYQK